MDYATSQEFLSAESLQVLAKVDEARQELDGIIESTEGAMQAEALNLSEVLLEVASELRMWRDRYILSEYRD